MSHTVPGGVVDGNNDEGDDDGVGDHTDPELQAIVQGLEVSSPWFRAIFGVLFCGYDV